MCSGVLVCSGISTNRSVHNRVLHVGDNRCTTSVKGFIYTQFKIINVCIYTFIPAPIWDPDSSSDRIVSASGAGGRALCAGRTILKAIENGIGSSLTDGRIKRS